MPTEPENAKLHESQIATPQAVTGDVPAISTNLPAPTADIADAPTKPAPRTGGVVAPSDVKRMSLVKLVAGGTVVVTGAGGALFAWLAWLLSHQPAPLRGNSGWWTWLTHVNGDELFNSARTTATILAVVGIGGAALVAYRRQDTAERSHEVAIGAQQIATDQLALDSRKYELDRDRHTLGILQRTDDRERELRARFTTVAGQLGSTNYAVRHAGAYALASLADDWHRFENDNERQVCVDLLCAQLRSPRGTDGPDISSAAHSDQARDLEVRKTIVALLRSHRPVEAPNDDHWKSCSIDLSGADLSTFNLEGFDLSAANLDDANLSGARLIRANLTKAMMARTTLSGTTFSDADLRDAKLFSCRTAQVGEENWRSSASFSDSRLQEAWFTSAHLPHADFEDSDLTGAKFFSAELSNTNFVRAVLGTADFREANLSDADFSGADLRGTGFVRANISGAIFEDAVHDDQTRWPRGIAPDGLRPA